MASKIETKEEKRQHNVNLLHRYSQAPQIARCGQVTVDRWVIPLLNKDIIPTVLELEIKVKEPSGLVIRDISHLLSLIVNGKEQTDNKITITAHETPYIVAFNADEVIDCKLVETGAENSVFPIEYSLILKRKKKVIEKLSSSIDVVIEPIGRVEPEITFVPSDEYKLGLVYDGHKKDPFVIGNIQVRNSGKLFRAPALNLSLGIEGRIDDTPVPGLICLGKDVRISGGRPFLDPALGTSSNIVTEKSCTYCNILEDGKAYIHYLISVDLTEEDRSYVDTYVEIPVLLNLRQTSNPIGDKINIDLYGNTIFSKYYEPAGTKNSSGGIVGSVTLERNKRMMDLEVFAGPAGFGRHKDTLLKNNATCDLSAEYPGWGQNGQVAPKLHFDYLINNTADATDPDKENAAIIVKDLRIEEPKGADGCRIQLAEEKKILGDMFFVDYEQRTIKLPVASDPFVIPISYTDQYLEGITDNRGSTLYNTYVEIPVSFSYFIDREGDFDEKEQDYNFQTFRSTLRIRIFKRARPEWLCVDFGTSAVAASFAKNITRKNNLLQLQPHKVNFIRKRWTDYGDKGEGSDFLISSAVILQKPKIEFNQDYPQASAMFSPPTDMIEYYKRLLPCLKSLVGNEYLPKELIPTIVADEGQVRVEIKALLRLVYEQLFRYFLPEKAKESERMVLSFPNTFSPVHIQTIREIAKESFPQLRPDYLRFISESDAVAFYYNYHRQSFIGNTSNFSPQSDDFDKHILVYDMGAGTLDLTYFVRTKVSTGNGASKIRISIEGKMGVNKAGNYLDYVLAEILVDRLCQQKGLKSDIPDKLRSLMNLQPGEETYDQSLQYAVTLKDYVKNQLKPLLNNEPGQALEGPLQIYGVDFNLKRITIGDIVSDTRFTDFVKEVTEEVFANFVALFGKGDEEARSLPIDLVIFSGRTTGLLELRKAVRDKLNIFGQQEKETIFADLSARSYINCDEYVKDVTGLKTVVVDGALAYCISKNGFELINSNVYATYGVFLENNFGSTEWLPLIDYRTKPVNSNGNRVVSDDGIIIKTYDSHRFRAQTTSPVNPENVFFSSYRKITFVQTYSRKPLEDWTHGRREFISVIGSIQIDTNGDDKPHKIRLQIDKNNNLIFSIDNLQQTQLMHEDYQSESFARAMWPIVKVSKE